MATHKISNLFKGDRTLWGIYFFLISISLIEVFSAGSSLSFKSGNYISPLFAQGVVIFLGFLSIVVLSHWPCRWFRAFSLILYLPGLILLAGVFFLGDDVNGGVRSYSLLGINIQPSEFIKPLLISVVASLMSTLRAKKYRKAKLALFFITLVATLCVVIFIVTENFSTAALILATVGVMFLMAEVPWIWLAKLLGAVLLGGALLFLIVKSDIIHISRFETWNARLERFGDSKLSPIEQNRPDLVDLDRDGQKTHAKIAIASSGFFGKGAGNSTQRDYLSQAYSDFIFAIIIEEFGLLGGFFVISLYIWLYISCIRISRRCTNPYPSYLIIGLGTIILFQALINVWVSVDLMPITGQNLPLISRGGSSMIATSIMFGMMLSVSRFARRSTPPKDLSQLTQEECEELEQEARFTEMGPE